MEILEDGPKQHSHVMCTCIQPTRILHICRQLPGIANIRGHACKIRVELTKRETRAMPGAASRSAQTRSRDWQTRRDFECANLGPRAECAHSCTTHTNSLFLSAVVSLQGWGNWIQTMFPAK